MRWIFTLLLVFSFNTASYGFWSSKPAEESAGIIIPVKPGAKEKKKEKKEEEPPATVIKIVTMYCPTLKKIVKQGLFWGAAEGWRSYSQSFVDEIDTFLGAKWTGVNVGKMACIYKGKKAYTFLVILQNDKLVPVPTGGKWGPLTDGNVNCHSGNPFECGFKYEEKKTDIKRVYEELEFKPEPEGYEGP